MPEKIRFYCQGLLPLYLAILFAPACYSQTDSASIAPTKTNWKTTQLLELDRQLAVETESGACRDELEAQSAWLKNWTEGSMSSRPKRSARQQPAIRSEPILDSAFASDLRKRLMGKKETGLDDPDFLTLKQALIDHPHDLGLLQLHLHWLDHPIRRKTNLHQVERSASRLIHLLASQTGDDPTILLASEFAKYRRARALAYRELPDVVKQNPIKHPERFDRALRSAYRELQDVAGGGRPEFILLEIRMLRRDGYFGTALSLLEEYGSTIKPQWYLKKRRDLLRELGWVIAAKEAATIYELEFPEEVAKEKSLNAGPTQSSPTGDENCK